MTLEKTVYKNIRRVDLLVFVSIALLLIVDRATTVVAIILIVFGTVYIVKNKLDFISLDKNIQYLIFAFLFIFLTSLIPFVTDNFDGIYLDRSLRFLLIIPAVLYLFRAEINPSSIFAGAVTGSFLALVISLYQYYYLNMPRVDGHWYSITFGYASCALAFLSAGALIYFKSKTSKVIALAGIAAALYSMMLSGTRGAYIAVPVLLLLFLVFYYKSLSFKKIFLMIVGFVGIAILAYTFNEQTHKRVDSIIYELTVYEKADTEKARTSSGLRVEMWRASWITFLDSPIWGTGYPDREVKAKELFDSGYIVDLTGLKRMHAHNEVVEITVTRGIFGLAAILAIYLVPMIYFYRRSKSRDPNIKVLAVTGFVFVVGFIIYGISETPLQRNDMSTFYVLMLAYFYATIQYTTNRVV